MKTHTTKHTVISDDKRIVFIGAKISLRQKDFCILFTIQTGETPFVKRQSNIYYLDEIINYFAYCVIIQRN